MEPSLFASEILVMYQHQLGIEGSPPQISPMTRALVEDLGRLNDL